MVQLSVKRDELKPLVGKEVVVAGKTFWAETGSHHTPMMMEVERIENAMQQAYNHWKSCTCKAQFAGGVWQ